MGKFILGVIITLLVLVLGGLGFAMLGFFPTAGECRASALERRLAMSAVDASMERHAPRVTNPLTPTDQNLEDGMKLYTMNCALCHGGLDRKPSTLANSFYPPAAEPHLRSAGRSRVAHLLHDSHRHSLHRHACLGQNSERTGHVEDHDASSRTWTNFRPLCRNTGRPASASRQPAKKRQTGEKHDHHDQAQRTQDLDLTVAVQLGASQS